MRIFNSQLVFDQTIRGAGTKYYSSADLNDLLGKADEVAYEAEVSEASGTSLTLTVKHAWGASGIAFPGATTVIDAATFDASTDLPFRKAGTAPGPLGGFARLEVSLGGSSPVGRVRIWATGRST